MELFEHLKWTASEILDFTEAIAVVNLIPLLQ